VLARLWNFDSSGRLTCIVAVVDVEKIVVCLVNCSSSTISTEATDLVILSVEAAIDRNLLERCFEPAI